jgi:hypothetical protein
MPCILVDLDRGDAFGADHLPDEPQFTGAGGVGHNRTFSNAASDRARYESMMLFQPRSSVVIFFLTFAVM